MQDILDMIYFSQKLGAKDMIVTLTKPEVMELRSKGYSVRKHGKQYLIAWHIQ